MNGSCWNMSKTRLLRVSKSPGAIEHKPFPKDQRRGRELPHLAW
jgi:hypothetical protein